MKKPEQDSMDSEYDLQLPKEIEQYERKIYDLKQLIEISKGLNSTLEYNTLIDSVLLTCMGQMQLLRAGIFLRKGIGYDNLTLHRNYKGFDIDHTIDYEIYPDSLILAFLEKKHRCFTLEELENKLPGDYSLTVLKTLEPNLIVPLISKGELNGIIILGERINERVFSESEKEFLLTLGTLAGIAVHNATLYEMATTDMMTKLKIHHYFHTALIEEIDRAIKFKRPLSLIMSDIDHFKSFNDNYGHSLGDEVIRNVARIIRSCVRQIDIPARYGGEEFAVILPKTDINEALIVAERIRLMVENDRVKHHDKELSVTMSVGVTEFDHAIDNIDKNSFIERADKALYLSKKNGRNIVSIL